MMSWLVLTHQHLLVWIRGLRSRQRICECAFGMPELISDAAGLTANCWLCSWLWSCFLLRSCAFGGCGPRWDRITSKFAKGIAMLGAAVFSGNNWLCCWWLRL